MSKELPINRKINKLISDVKQIQMEINNLVKAIAAHRERLREKQEQLAQYQRDNLQ